MGVVSILAIGDILYSCFNLDLALNNKNRLRLYKVGLPVRPGKVTGTDTRLKFP